MELPIDQKDLKTIVNALALGGDARLYHKLKDELKGVREEYEMNGNVITGEYRPNNGECDI